MRIDLHCHTKEIKEGDKGRDITAESFARKMSDNQVKFAAMTNHNFFDLREYEEFRKAVAEVDAEVWPGIELDIKGRSGAVGHVIVVADPECAAEFSMLCEEAIGDGDPATFDIDWQKMAEIYTKGSFGRIVIAHYGAPDGSKLKDKALPYGDAQALKDLFPDDIPFLFEPSNLKKAGVMYESGVGCFLGTDTKNWEQYGEKEIPELKLPVGNFAQFLLLLKKTPETLKTIMDAKNSEMVTVQLFDDPQPVELRIYNDVNIVFGAKGTGKTALLNEIEKHYSSRGKSEVSVYRAADAAGQYRSMTKIVPKSEDFEKLGISDCEQEFKLLESWRAPVVTPFEQYIRWQEEDETNRELEHYGFAKASSSARPDLEKVGKIAEQYAELSASISAVIDNQLYVHLSSSEDRQLFGEVCSRILASARNHLRNEFCKNFGEALEKFTIENLKSHYQVSTGRPTRPSETGLYRLYDAKRKGQLAARAISDALKQPSFPEVVVLGELVEKGEVRRCSTYLVNPRHGTGIVFANPQVKTNDLKGLVDTIGEIANESIGYGEFGDKIASFCGQCEAMKIDSLRDFFGVATHVECGSDKAYEPSSGEKAMLVLTSVLFSPGCSVYILDEPEASMGNEFINRVIVEQINKLAKMDKTIIVSTHNANIAVRTLPWQTVYREYKDGRYITFTGNPFTDILRDVDGKAEDKGWAATSLKMLEGGKEAFEERGVAYGKQR